jgi:glycosyltransferase involved in cell wall biosynthesis
MLDAMACGTPMVGTRTGGIPEAIEHERTGLLVRPHHADELAAAIVRLLQAPNCAPAFAPLDARTWKRNSVWTGWWKEGSRCAKAGSLPGPSRLLFRDWLTCRIIAHRRLK